jgi:hypothetical protein
MKLFKRFLTGMGVAALLSMVGVSKSDAQIWAYYDMEIANQFFNPLVGSTTEILDVDFRDFSNFGDLDDGVANNIPVGFDFEYNNGIFNSVNVCVNGWASIGVQQTPVITHDIYYLFRANQPNNTLAPFWGDHMYRLPAETVSGYKPTTIHYSTIAVPDDNPCAAPGSLLRTFTVEWRDLNINDKPNVNSVATFQIKIIQNPYANDCNIPDHRATIEFHYGSIGNLGTVRTQGSTVGIEDSVSDSLAHSFMNGLFPSSFAGEDSTRRNDDSLTTCWPPATCLPGRVIRFVPEGRNRFQEWGDGDVNLTQLDNTLGSEIRLNQNRFVTLADADSLLRASARAYPPLDSVEGRQAFHGDANHNGRYTNPLFPGFYFYRANAYDAAYILMYLAAKLPFLPWPQPLPVPVYKEVGSETTNISGIYADVKGATVRGNTTIVPVVLRGTANGALAFEANVKSMNTNTLQFAGVESAKGLIRHNAVDGKVVFAAAGAFADGDVLGYLQFTAEPHATTDFELNNVVINDEPYASQHSTLAIGANGQEILAGNALEQNTPNPFFLGSSSLTTIPYSVENATLVTVKVFDMLGNEVRALLVNESVTAGAHEIKWDGRDNSGTSVASGAYYYQLTTSEFTKIVKMQVVR